VKKILITLALLAGIYAAYVIVSLVLLPPVAMLADRKLNMTITVRDWQGRQHPFVVGPRNRYWTPLSRIPAEMKWAVILAEDTNFYKHEGIDAKAIRQAIKHDLEKKSLSRGASTITQQTAKTLLSRKNHYPQAERDLSCLADGAGVDQRPDTRTVSQCCGAWSHGLRDRQRFALLLQ